MKPIEGGKTEPGVVEAIKGGSMIRNEDRHGSGVDADFQDYYGLVGDGRLDPNQDQLAPTLAPVNIEYQDDQPGANITFSKRCETPKGRPPSALE